jgi:hypothetical protein
MSLQQRRREIACWAMAEPSARCLKGCATTLASLGLRHYRFAKTKQRKQRVPPPDAVTGSLMVAKVKDCLGEGLRRLLRWIVAHVVNYSTFVVGGEIPLVPLRVLMRVDVIGSTVNDDRGHSDCGQARQTGVQWRITRIASRVAHAMAIGVDDHLDKVWIVERSSRSLEARIIKCPARRPKPPQQSSKFATPRSQPPTSPFRLKIMLIPIPALLFCNSRLACTSNILDLIAGAGHQSLNTFGPKRRNNAGGPIAPIETRQYSLPNVQHIEQFNNILRQRRLLS